MGQQIIKSVKKDKSFKLKSLTENRKIRKKIYGLTVNLNSENVFKDIDLIIDFTIPQCTFQILKIASKLKKKSCYWNYGIFKKRGKVNSQIFKKKFQF